MFVPKIIKLWVIILLQVTIGNVQDVFLRRSVYVGNISLQYALCGRWIFEKCVIAQWSHVFVIPGNCYFYVNALVCGGLDSRVRLWSSLLPFCTNAFLWGQISCSIISFIVHWICNKMTFCWMFLNCVCLVWQLCYENFWFVPLCGI